MKDIGEFKEFDLEGEENLRAIAAADQFNHWMYSQIQPYCKGKILEIGSGIGNISRFFVENKQDIDLSDIRNQYRSYLRKKFSSRQCIDIDIVGENFDIVHAEKIGTYDAIFALNVVEHIKDDRMALLNMVKLLKPGGNIVILVPAYQYLYNGFDRALEHFRRYTKYTLMAIFPNNAQLVKTWHFNFAGIFGWFLVGTIFRKKVIPESNMRVYNVLTPLFKLADKVVCNSMGLSVIAVYQKK
ncbi:MAG: methyltransferase type 12 [Flavobacteriales bacterium]|nr:MAG: methyltransferase type 12 [Flavobacteriales bacterium]